MFPSTQSSFTASSHHNTKKTKKRRSKRCAQCRKRLFTNGFMCKCSQWFCDMHRHMEDHACALAKTETSEKAKHEFVAYHKCVPSKHVRL